MRRPLALVGILLCSRLAVAGEPLATPEAASATSAAAPEGALSLAEELARPRPKVPQQGGIASGYIYVPAVANAAGAFGAIFRTRLSVLLASSPSSQVELALYPSSGSKRTATFNINPGETITFEDVIANAFNYTGGGGLRVRTLSSSGKIIVTADVYAEGPNGRFSTASEALNILDFVGSTYPDLTVGVLVDSLNRANVGCMNDGFSTSTVLAKFYAANGSAIGTVTFTLPVGTWVQTPVPFQVGRGTILWQTTSSDNYCYAVNVNNVSNDGVFLGRTTYVP